MATSNFPSSLDTTSALPASISDTASLNSPNHADMHEVTNDAIIEIEEKLGTGDTTASAGAVLIGTGSGASAWDTTPTFLGDVTVGVNGTGHDVKFFGDSTDHWMLWDQSADGLVLTLDSSIYFYDVGGENIRAASNGHLEINAGTTLDLTAPTIDLNASTVVNIDGELKINAQSDILTLQDSGATNQSGYIAFNDSGGTRLGYIGYAANDDIYIKNEDADGDIYLWAASGRSVAILGNILLGSNESGHDLTLYGATDGKFLLWDASDNMLEITGVDGTNALAIHNGNLYLADDATINGTVDINGATDIAGDLTLSGGGDGALRFSNAGENSIRIPDNQASALIIEEAGNAYMTFTTTNGSEAITMYKPQRNDYGSSSAPSVSFNGDSDTGMYRYTTNVIGFVGGLYLHTALPQTSTGTYATLRRFSDGRVKELTSSERFKKDIVDISVSDAYKVLDARPIHFRDKNDDSSAPLEAGLSAESLHDSGWTYAVTYDDDTTTPKGIHYEMLVAPLIKIVKDLNTRLTALEG